MSRADVPLSTSYHKAATVSASVGSAGVLGSAEPSTFLHRVIKETQAENRISKSAESNSEEHNSKIKRMKFSDVKC